MIMDLETVKWYVWFIPEREEKAKSAKRLAEQWGVPVEDVPLIVRCLRKSDVRVNQTKKGYWVDLSDDI